MTIIFKTENQSTYHIYPERNEWERIEAKGIHDPWHPLRTERGRVLSWSVYLGRPAVLWCPPIDDPSSDLEGRQITTSPVIELTYSWAAEVAMEMEMAAVHR